MKSLVLAAVAALCVVALPVSAAEKASTITTTTMVAPMSAEDCTAAMAKCKDDAACKADLETKGCVAPEAK